MSCLVCFYIFWIQPIHQICDLQILSPSLWLIFSFSWKSFLQQKFLILKKPKLSIFSCIDHILCHIWEHFAEFNVTKLSPVFSSQTSLSNISMAATNSMRLCCCSVTKSCHADQEAAVRTGHEQQTGSKSGKEYIKAVYCHPAYLTYTQGTSCEMLGWMKHKLESRLQGKISITSDMQMTPPLWQKVKKN